MRAVRFNRYGGPEVLEVVDIPRRAAGPGQVVVSVVAAATNPGEIGIREGHFADMWPAHFPEGQGNDFAGYVDEIGSGVGEFEVGDEVIGFAPREAQAEYVTLGVDRVAAKPAGMSWEAAATVAGAGATAWASVAAVNPRPGETVVVSATAGGVGIYAAQLARLRGAEVIGTCGEANDDLLTSLGIRPVRYGDGLSDRLKAMAPNGIDAFIDTYGAGNVALAINLRVEPGRINTLIDHDAVRRFAVHSEAQEEADTPEIWAELADLVARGDITVPIAAVYDLTTEQVRQAYRDVGSRHVSGKRVLRIGPTERQSSLI
ncbi:MULTISPECIES: NADP-dependent oxidoreductase [unclassified Mycobacterium]|uniref:NADP-dependent oxidoreductase n=1 Tax=unclassified Mycobacterium TaxID=2642494 RepID=UPI00055DFA1C|nr:MULTISPECIES: NADP-dependent oxidoreductase [unclassified Mycobacterium]SEB20764.1 NADPH:quinone reductase [Mycobacterium sp. 283mftsu]